PGPVRPNEIWRRALALRAARFEAPDWLVLRAAASRAPAFAPPLRRIGHASLRPAPRLRAASLPVRLRRKPAPPAVRARTGRQLVPPPEKRLHPLRSLLALVCSLEVRLLRRLPSASFAATPP